jgi:hypothetical protein
MNAQDRAALTQASRGGIAIFESMVAPPTLAAIKSKLDAAYEATPDHEQFFGCAKDIVHTLRDDAAFRELESEAVRAASNWLASTMHVDGKVGPWFGLRVGSSASTSGSHCRHFDSQVLTLVIVLQTASDDDRSGDLIVYPKARGIPRRRDNVLRKSMQWGERATLPASRGAHAAPSGQGAVHAHPGHGGQHLRVQRISDAALQSRCARGRAPQPRHSLSGPGSVAGAGAGQSPAPQREGRS